MPFVQRLPQKVLAIILVNGSSIGTWADSTDSEASRIRKLKETDLCVDRQIGTGRSMRGYWLTSIMSRVFPIVRHKTAAKKTATDKCPDPSLPQRNATRRAAYCTQIARGTFHHPGLKRDTGGDDIGARVGVVMISSPSWSSGFVSSWHTNTSQMRMEGL